MKQVSFHQPAQPDRVGTITIGRALPNAAVNLVGPFLLLDHLPRRDIGADQLPEPDGSFAHPHRGIVTLTYVLEGAMTHFDSLGNNSTVTAGGVQWMNAGSGIIHDESSPRPCAATAACCIPFSSGSICPRQTRACLRNTCPFLPRTCPLQCSPVGVGK